MGRNRVIGVGGKMPWHLPADLRHFRQVTGDRPLIMGRRTWEAIGRALPGRTSIVLSRGSLDLPAGVAHADTLEAALELAGPGDVMIIGGGELYRQTLPLAARMELSFVDAEPEGDTTFPEWDAGEWRLVSMRARPADEKNAFRLVFCRFERRTQ